MRKNRCTTGALILIDGRGFIKEILIMAADDQQQTIVEGALARISKPDAWGWLRRLIGRGRE